MSNRQVRWNFNIHYHRVVMRSVPSNASNALDVGSGNGVLSFELADHGLDVVGIDPDGPSIERARADSNSSGRTTFVCADVFTNPFELASFDVVASNAMLHHVDAESGLRRMRDLVRPGGVLVIIGFATPSGPRDLALIAAGFVYKTTREIRCHYWEHDAPIRWPPPLSINEMRRLVEREPRTTRRHTSSPGTVRPSNGDRRQDALHRRTTAVDAVSFYRYCHVEGITAKNPAANVRRPKVDYESRTLGLDRNELGGLLVQAGLGPARDHALISLLAMNGLRISEALGADIEDLDTERGHRTLKILRKGGKHVTIPLAPRTARPLDLYVGERAAGPILLSTDGRTIGACGRFPRRQAPRRGSLRPTERSPGVSRRPARRARRGTCGSAARPLSRPARSPSRPTPAGSAPVCGRPRLCGEQCSLGRHEGRAQG